LGVTILALYRFSLALPWLILGFWYSSGGTWKWIHLEVFAIFVAAALLEVVLGVGLWRLKNWTRILTVVISVIWPGPSLVGGSILFYYAVYLGNLDRMFAMPWYCKLAVVLEPALRITIVIYLLLPHVARCFRTHQPS